MCTMPHCLRNPRSTIEGLKKINKKMVLFYSVKREIGIDAFNSNKKVKFKINFMILNGSLFNTAS